MEPLGKQLDATFTILWLESLGIGNAFLSFSFQLKMIYTKLKKFSGFLRSTQPMMKRNTKTTFGKQEVALDKERIVNEKEKKVLKPHEFDGWGR